MRAGTRTIAATYVYLGSLAEAQKLVTPGRRAVSRRAAPGPADGPRPAPARTLDPLVFPVSYPGRRPVGVDLSAAVCVPLVRQLA